MQHPHNITEIPQFRKHLADMKHFKSNNVHLFEGWSFTSEKIITNSEAGAA